MRDEITCNCKSSTAVRGDDAAGNDWAQAGVLGTALAQRGGAEKALQHQLPVFDCQLLRFALLQHQAAVSFGQHVPVNRRWTWAAGQD